MAEIEITLPTVAYANVKVTFSPEELGVDISDAAAIGVATAVYLNLFTQGFKEGAKMDVSAPVSASEEGYEELAQANAQELLDEGLGGVTEISEDGDDIIADNLEAEARAPWNSKVDAKPKPWETEATAPAVVSEDW